MPWFKTATTWWTSLIDSWCFFPLHISRILILWQFHCFKDEKEYISFYLYFIYLAYVDVFMSHPFLIFFLLGAVTLCVLVCVDKLLISYRQNNNNKKEWYKREIFLLALTIYPHMYNCIISTTARWWVFQWDISWSTQSSENASLRNPPHVS